MNMQVSYIQYALPRYNSQQPSFKSNKNEVLNAAGQVVNKTVTYMFRNDFEWNNFARLLAYKYKDTNKVHITNYACSDGSEPYTLSMALLEKVPEFSQKLFPIVAKDKFQHVLDYAQSGICNIYQSDIYSINYFTNNKFSHYFQAVPATIRGCFMGVKPKEPLKDKIIFQQADILDDLKNLPDENNVILCRNFWVYLGPENYHKLAEMLYEKTRNNGLIVIGALENGHNIPQILCQHGFKETYITNVYSTK